jgi:hypothetical protein
MKPTHFPIPRNRCVLALALALTAGALFCQPAFASSGDDSPGPQTRPQTRAQRVQPRPEDPGKRYGKEANPGLVYKETKGKSALHSKGAQVREVHGRAAGKPISAMKGAKPLTRGAWKAMKDIPKTGLFLVDLDFIPPGLQEDLKKNGYRLSPDGTLTKDGNPVALFVHGQDFQVKPEKDVGKPAGKGNDAQAELTDWPGRSLWQLVDFALSLLASDAEAASPFPWRCASWYFKWEYNGGFCRNYKAWSNAYAWGPGSDGSCANPKPLTHIEYISTYVSVAGHTDWDYHYNADQSHSYAKWNIGCFWPAHGGASGFHYGYWRDGSAWMYRTWSW